jgi:hypothetical protein
MSAEPAAVGEEVKVNSKTLLVTVVLNVGSVRSAAQRHLRLLQPMLHLLPLRLLMLARLLKG